MASTQTSSSSVVNNEDRFLYLKEVAIDFTRSRPNGRLQIKLKDEKGTRYESKVFGETEPLQWDCELYVKSSTAMMTIQSSSRTLRRDLTVKLQLDFSSSDFRENDTVERSSIWLLEICHTDR